MSLAVDEPSKIFKGTVQLYIYKSVYSSIQEPSIVWKQMFTFCVSKQRKNMEVWKITTIIILLSCYLNIESLGNKLGV